MFQSLQENLHSAFKSLAGQGKMTEGNIRAGLEQVEQALLEADVAFPVVQDFMARVSERAVGKEVLLALKPSEQVLKIVYDELVELLGPVDNQLPYQQGGVLVMMLCGLQGSGKTTTCGKLARRITQEGHKPLLVAADLQRPAAIEQLHVLGKQLNLPVHSELGQQDPVKVCRDGVAKAKASGCDVVILDTAGRLAIDQELMAQLQQIDRQVQPDEVLLVVDGMTGQDAVNSAKAFNEALELNGVIMTKLDGDARGGALLSVKAVTGVPIKFIGVGEHLHSLEQFRPDGMARRILGGGDLAQMLDVVTRELDRDEMEKAQQKMAEGRWTLEDFRSQMQMLMQPGLMQTLMSYIPGMSQLTEMMGGLDPSEFKRVNGIIDSMTKAERNDPRIIDTSRRVRIAQGSGVEPKMVADLIKQFDQMRGVMEGMAGKSMNERMAAVQQMQQSMMADPSRGLAGVKTGKGTGTRLSSKEKKDRRKAREKNKKKKRRF